MKKFRGGVQIQTQKSCSFSSFGTWDITDSTIVVKACFRTVKILKDSVIEIRVKRRLTPEFKVVYKVEDGAVNISSIAVFTQKKKDLIKEVLLLSGFLVSPETKWEPKGQAQRDEEVFGLLEDTA